MRNVPLRRPARALAAAVLILAAVLLGAPGSASAHGGRGHAWGRSRGAYRATSYRPAYGYRSYRTYGYRTYGYRPYYRSYAYRPYYRAYAYRPYVAYATPVYRRVVVDDPYCDDDDDVTYARPVYHGYRHARHHPRVAVSLSFGSPGYFVGDPYCGW